MGPLPFMASFNGLLKWGLHGGDPNYSRTGMNPPTWWAKMGS